MKIFFLLPILILLGAGCVNNTSNQNITVQKLEQEITNLKSQIQNVSTSADNIENTNELEKYIDISQNNDPLSVKADIKAREDVKDIQKAVHDTVVNSKAEADTKAQVDALSQAEASAKTKTDIEIVKKAVHDDAAIKEKAEADAKVQADALDKAKTDAWHTEGVRVLELINLLVEDIDNQTITLNTEILDVEADYTAISNKAGITIGIADGMRTKLLSNTNYYIKLDAYDSLLDERDILILIWSAVAYSAEHMYPLDYQHEATLIKYGITTSL